MECDDRLHRCMSPDDGVQKRHGTVWILNPPPDTTASAFWCSWGVHSVIVPMPAHHAAWKRLARDLDPAHLGTTTQVEPMTRLLALVEAILAGQVRGRVVIGVAR